MVLKYMDNIKTPTYYLLKIIEDINFVIDNTIGMSIEEFSEDEVLNCAVSFKFIQISENAKQLPTTLMEAYSQVPWKKINGLRNRIVHDYGNVQLDIIYNTIEKDLPFLLEQVKALINN